MNAARRFFKRPLFPRALLPRTLHPRTLVTRAALTHTLYGAAALFAAVGLMLRLTPIPRPRVPQPDVRDGDLPVTRHVQTAAAGGITPNGSDPIINANIFARSRVAPIRAGAVPHADHKPATPTVHEPTFALFGTTIGPRGAVALISAGGAPGGHVHAIGDIIDGARLVAITDSTVTLERGGKPFSLHVPRIVRQQP